MRISTILFLALFAAIFGNHHRERQLHRHQAQAHEAAYQASHPAADAAARELERELTGLSRRLRDSDRAVRSLDQAARRLQDLLRHADHESCSKSQHLASAATRREARQEVEAQLREVMAGRQQLLDEKASLVSRQAILQARLEMARAGLLPPEDDGGIDYRAWDKPSPLEALTEQESAADRATVLVVR